MFSSLSGLRKEKIDGVHNRYYAFPSLREYMGHLQEFFYSQADEDKHRVKQNVNKNEVTLV